MHPAVPTSAPQSSNKQMFGGGTGAGVSVTPVAFLVVSGGNVRTVQLVEKVTAVDNVIAALPEIADSSSSTSDSTDTDDDLTLGGDITDAYDKYAGGVDSGLDDVKDQYDGLVNDSTLGFVQAVTSWIPTEFWVIVGLSIGSLVVLGIVSWLKG